MEDDREKSESGRRFLQNLLENNNVLQAISGALDGSQKSASTSSSTTSSSASSSVNAELRNLFRPASKYGTASNSAPRIGIASTSNTTTQPTQSASPLFSLQRNFGTKQSKRPAPRRQPKVPTGPFLKDVILLERPEEDNVPRQGRKLWLTENGHVVYGVTFSKECSLSEVTNTIRSVFPDKLGENVEFEILTSVHNKVMAPKLAPGQVMNGYFIYKLFGNSKPLYVRPSVEVLEPECATEEPERNTKRRKVADLDFNFDDHLSELSDQDDLPSVLNGNKKTTCKEPNPLQNPTEKKTEKNLTTQPEIPETQPEIPEIQHEIPEIQHEIPETAAEIEPSTSALNEDEKEIDRDMFLIREYAALLSQEDDFSDSESESSICDVNVHEAETKEFTSTDTRDCEEDKEDISLEHILQELALSLRRDETNISKFNICRSNVWDAALRGLKRKSFSPFNKISVKFTDDVGKSEGAVDLGGPQREFLTLLMEYLSRCTMFVGDSHCKTLSNVARAVKEDHYYYAGCSIALSLVHGGPGPQFLAPVLFNAIVFGPEKTEVNILSVPDISVRQSLQKLQDATSIDDIFDHLEELSTIIDLAGTMQPVTKPGDQHAIVANTAHWYVMGRTRPAFERFKDGLDTLGVLQAMKQHPSAFKSVLCYEERALTAEQVEDLFKTLRTGEKESNKFKAESKVLSFWFDYLQDREEETSTHHVSLTSILFFATGCKRVPPMGFTRKPSLGFLHEEDFQESQFPKANTCSCNIYLPVVHDTYEKFKEAMDFAIANCHGFGYA